MPVSAEALTLDAAFSKLDELHQEDPPSGEDGLGDPDMPFWLFLNILMNGKPESGFFGPGHL